MGDQAAALARLDEVTRRLRRECPWDREQDERSIVPHTVEEAYELADAAHRGDDDALVDELGDVLFQVLFLSLLLEERGAGSLSQVAEGCRRKLVRRHPHVFGQVKARTAGEVVWNWDEIKRRDEREGQVFGQLPETLPSLLHAQKVQKRAARAGVAGERHAGEALSDAGRRCQRFFSPGWSEESAFQAVGELLFDVVDAARDLGVDPELALRHVANGYRQDIEGAGTE